MDQSRSKASTSKVVELYSQIVQQNIAKKEKKLTSKYEMKLLDLLCQMESW